MTEHEFFMHQAIALAKKAGDLGEVPVGALIVKQGKIIAQGYNLRETKQSATAHGEMVAIEAACQALGNRRLKDCVMYVTMEPCPMCGGAAVLSQISTLVFGCYDSLWGGAGSIFNIPEHPLTNPKIQVIGGILEQECKELMQNFFQEQRKILRTKKQ